VSAEPVVCWCGQPARGDSATTPATGSVWHWCRQCSALHCELDRYIADRRAEQSIADAVRYIPHS